MISIIKWYKEKKMSKIVSRTKIKLFIFLIAMVVTCFLVFGVNNVVKATPDFSVELKYARNFFPKGSVGKAYDLSDVISVNGSVDYEIRCKVNFDDQSEFTVTNKKGESTVYRVISSHAESDWLKLSEGMGVQITKTSGSMYVSDEKGNRITDIQKVTTGQ